MFTHSLFFSLLHIIYAIYAKNKKSLLNFVEWVKDSFFIIEDGDNSVVATIKCNIIIENEKVSNLKHWPKSGPCTMWKINPSIRSTIGKSRLEGFEE